MRSDCNVRGRPRQSSITHSFFVAFIVGSGKCFHSRLSSNSIKFFTSETSFLHFHSVHWGLHYGDVECATKDQTPRIGGVRCCFGNATPIDAIVRGLGRRSIARNSAFLPISLTGAICESLRVNEFLSFLPTTDFALVSTRAKFSLGCSSRLWA